LKPNVIWNPLIWVRLDVLPQPIADGGLGMVAAGIAAPYPYRVVYRPLKAHRADLSSTFAEWPLLLDFFYRQKQNSRALASSAVC
jgi:hypothetical protein